MPTDPVARRSRSHHDGCSPMNPNYDPLPWANRQTELVWRWMNDHRDLLPLFRATAAGGERDLASHVADYLLPVHPASSPQAALAHVALEEVDWGQLRRRLDPSSNGTSG